MLLGANSGRLARIYAPMHHPRFGFTINNPRARRPCRRRGSAETSALVIQYTWSIPCSSTPTVLYYRAPGLYGLYVFPVLCRFVPFFVRFVPTWCQFVPTWCLFVSVLKNIISRHGRPVGGNLIGPGGGAFLRDFADSPDF